MLLIENELFPCTVELKCIIHAVLCELDRLCQSWYEPSMDHFHMGILCQTHQIAAF